MAESSDTLVTVKSNSSSQTENNEHTDGTDTETNEKVSAVIPQLVAESTLLGIPPNLHTIIANLNGFGGSNTNGFDLLISVLYVLMVECGFVPNGLVQSELPPSDFHTVDFHLERVMLYDFLPLNWKTTQPKGYSFEFHLQPYPRHICRMVCYKMTTSLVVNVLLAKGQLKSAIYPVSRYINNEDWANVPRKYQHLSELSIDFKNNLANWAKIEILRQEGVDQPILQDLPPEVLYQIFLNLPSLEYVHLRATCRHILSSACYFANNLWKYYFKRDFPKEIVRDEDIVWFEKYKEKSKIDVQVKHNKPNRFQFRLSDLL